MATGKKATSRTLERSVTLRIEPKIVRQLDAIARKVQRSRSNLIRLALEDFVRKST